MRPRTEPAITDNQIGFNSSRMIWERRQGLAIRSPFNHCHWSNLCLLTLASGPIYANFGSGGIGVMGALYGEALPPVHGSRQPDWNRGSSLRAKLRQADLRLAQRAWFESVRGHALPRNCLTAAQFVASFGLMDDRP
jgi:hypothetical protein